ncbi:MAG: TauD/TfdA family dioxygenase [Novosphingobium sp.]|uniref:TauD/TfdA dioxygenase family protein n=1 Tax=Novosphingobium sp. TaxID=1874826 RepID=UPI0032BA84B7
MLQRLETRDYTSFRIVPRTPVIGGWIEGCNLADLDESGLAELRDALWHYGVLFGRGQNLSFEAMKRVALAYGDRLEEHTFAPTKADEGHPEVVVIERLNTDQAKATTDLWHHDVLSRKHPNIMSILQAEQVPFGADTMWASMVSAYERLPLGLKLLFESIEIEHDSLYLMLRHDFGDPTIVEKIIANREHAVHPAVVRHHATGKPCLMVGDAYVQRIKGYETSQSEALIKLANEMSRIPEIQVRHQWEPGDVAIWDNFGTSHYGVSADIGASLRRLHRVASWSESVRPEPYCIAPLAQAAE